MMGAWRRGACSHWVKIPETGMKQEVRTARSDLILAVEAGSPRR